MKKEFTREMVDKVLAKIAKKNGFFVSEAHLQTEFIIAAAELYEDFSYYPELVPGRVPTVFEEKYKGKAAHFDLLIKTKTQNVLIEFKYLTNKFLGEINGMKQEVKSHMAVDIRRHDCWQDIERIEKFAFENDSDVDYGYFILVTNAPAYWEVKESDSVDNLFRIHEGEHKAGVRKWKDGTKEGTNHGRTTPIETICNYNFEYKNFSKLPGKYGTFKSLVVEIGK